MKTASSAYRKGLACIILAACLFLSPAWGGGEAWTRLDDGLHLGTFSSPVIAGGAGDSIVILRIDPRYYELRLLSASEHEKKSRAIDRWCREFGLTAAINASMYAADYLTSTGYMRNGTHVNNRSVNPRFGAFLVFNPNHSRLPPVQIVDRHHQDWSTIVAQYDTVVQNYRLITLTGENSWRRKENERISSHAAVGMDRAGNVLFIVNPLPCGTHDFGEALRSLPLNLLNAMYVEGGSEASLFLNHGGRQERWGDPWQTIFESSGDGGRDPLLPNVIGAKKRN